MRKSLFENFLDALWNMATSSPTKKKQKKSYCIQEHEPYRTNYKSYEYKKRKGEDYEKYISNVFRSRGYEVVEHGLIMGYEDNAIDIIARNEKDLIFIQCKDWNEYTKNKITRREIAYIRATINDYLEIQEHYKKENRKIHLLIVTSGEILDISAKKYIEELRQRGKNINYEIINKKY